MLRHRAERQPDEVAFTYLVDGEREEVSITYSELDRKARAIGAWLEDRGLRGHRALLLYPAGLDFIAGFFGCLYGGVIAVPAYPPRMNRSLDRIQAITADAEGQVALSTAAVMERVQPLLDQTPDLKQLRWLATDTVPLDWEHNWREPEIRTDTVAFLQYTSGSTGMPKGVVLSHGNLLHNCALICHGFEHTRSSRGMFWLPNYHDMGLVGGILQPLYVGRPNVLMSPIAFLQRPYRWLQAISRYRATTSGGPNFAYDLCVRKITAEQRSRLDLSSWKVAFNGAEPVRSDTIRQFTETFAPCGFNPEAFYPCYGLAEATLIVTGGFQSQPPVVRDFDADLLEQGQARQVEQAAGDCRRLVGSGQRLPDQQIVIVDPDTLRPCPPGRIGEIWVSGPSVAQGYWQRHDETEQTFRARLREFPDLTFLRTGDLGFFDQDDLFVTGRLKDLIIIHGLNHYPQDIELTVERAHAGIRPGCGAAFTTEADGDSQLVVVYEVERRQRHNYDQIAQAIRRSVSREHDLPLGTIVLIRAGSIPKTSSGKIQRNGCRLAYKHRELVIVHQWQAEPSAPPPTAEVLAAAAPPAPSVVQRDAEPAAPRLVIQDHRAKQGETIAASAWPASPDNAAPDDAAELASIRQRMDEVRAAVSQQASRENGHAAAGRTVIDVVMDAVRRVAKERAAGLSPDSNLLELGMDSLERMEILASLEDRFGGRLPEAVLADLETCRDVARAVETYLGREPAALTRRSAEDIPAEYYCFDRYPEYVKLRQNLELLDASGLGNPYFSVHERVTRDTTIVAGREMINFASYNYVGTSGHPLVAQAAKEAIDRYGTSVSASRLVSGEKALHLELERAIADFIGAEDAIVYVSGHATNVSTIGQLFGPGDLILHDALAHNSIVQGAILSGARRRPFPHNDWRAVDELLAEIRGDYRRVLIAVEGVYSMDGDIADLPRFVEVKRAHKALLLVDEAHSLGVLGAHGRGASEHFDLPASDVDLWMGTLSKSLGSCGGYIAGAKAVVEYLKYTSPGFVFSVGISPPDAAAALASIRLLAAEPQRVSRLRQRATLFLELARQRGLNTGLSSDSAVVPVILGNSLHCLQASRAMARRGVNVQPILHPAVEERAARLRFFLTSEHTEEQIRYTIKALVEELARISPLYTGLDQPLGQAAGLQTAQR